jgi:hypothetical protein
MKIYSEAEEAEYVSLRYFLVYTQLILALLFLDIIHISKTVETRNKRKIKKPLRVTGDPLLTSYLCI